MVVDEHNSTGDDLLGRVNCAVFHNHSESRPTSKSGSASSRLGFEISVCTDLVRRFLTVTLVLGTTAPLQSFAVPPRVARFLSACKGHETRDKCGNQADQSNWTSGHKLPSHYSGGLFLIPRLITASPRPNGKRQVSSFHYYPQIARKVDNGATKGPAVQMSVHSRHGQ